MTEMTEIYVQTSYGLIPLNEHFAEETTKPMSADAQLFRRKLPRDERLARRKYRKEFVGLMKGYRSQGNSRRESYGLAKGDMYDKYYPEEGANPETENSMSLFVTGPVNYDDADPQKVWSIISQILEFFAALILENCGPEDDI